jgi:hypothetical protein
MSKIELPPLPPRATSKDFPGYAPPEDGNAAEHWAEGFNECRDLIAARDRQIVEVCAQKCEWLASVLSGPYESDGEYAVYMNAAAAIRNLIEESNNG